MFNKVWGTGVPLHHKDCIDRTQWHGIGIMGEMLMAIRAELRSHPDTSPTVPQTEVSTMDTEMANSTLTNG